MRDFNIPQLTVTVQQNIILPGFINRKDAYLVLDTNNNELVIDFNLIHEETFDTIDYSPCRYLLVVEYRKNDYWNCYNLNLTVNDLSCNDFFIEKNDDYHSLTQLLHKHILQERLLNKLKEKPSIKQKKI